MEIDLYPAYYRDMPLQKYSNTIQLLLLLTLVSVDGFGRPKSYKHHRKSASNTMMKHCNLNAATTDKSTNESSRDSMTVDYDPYYKCDVVDFGVEQKISYETSTVAGYDMIDVNFSSACVRCGVCLAVVQKINETLMEVHDSAALSTNHQWLENDQIDLVFSFVCNEQFRGYALREIDGIRYIGDSLPGAMLVITTADGRWENNLKSKCQDILKQAGTRDLYKHWQDWYEKASCDLADFLCRSEESVGLGDCRNIEGDGSTPENCQHFYHADIKVTAKFR